MALKMVGRPFLIADTIGDLPIATAAYHYWHIIVLGGSGEKDVEYVCLKAEDDNYYWAPTVLLSLPVDFTQGFGGAGVADEGWLINAVGEYAKARWINPDELTRILSIKIKCVATNAEVDGMLADFIFNASAPNEPYNTHTVTLASVVSTTKNYTAGDVVEFDITDAAISAATAGDKCSLEILYRAVVAPNEDTNGQFSSILVRYV